MSTAYRTLSQLANQATSQVANYLFIYLFSDELLDDNYNHWIGLTDRDVEGTFIWLDGSPVDFTNFESGQPDGSTAYVQNYVLMDPTSGEWDDYSDSHLTRSLCKKPATVAV